MRKIRIVEKKLGRERVFGQCYKSLGIIEVDPRQRARVYLNTLVHELLHATFRNASETHVARAAGVITQGLWKQRFRRIER